MIENKPVVRKEKRLVKVCHYNYSNNVKCDDVKPIERKFFRYAIRQLDYKSFDTITGKANTIVPMRHIISDFSIKYNVPEKQLVYYLKKWVDFGIYDYDSLISYGYFTNIHMLISCYTKSFHIKSHRDGTQYKYMVPERVKRLLFSELYRRHVQG